MPEQAGDTMVHRRLKLHSLFLVAGLTLGACAPLPPRVTTQPAPAPQPPPSTEVFFYPTKGQNTARQDRDRYECYLWAVKQTGFDPSAPQLAPHQRYKVVPQPPPGRDTVAGAAAGALLGAAVSQPGRAAEGAIAGAVTGAVVGAAADAARQEQAERLQKRYDQGAARNYARFEQQAQSYRRAMAACLEGRGYTVR